MSDITNELDFKSALEQFKQNSKPAPSTETEESTRSIFDFPPQSIPEGMVIENPISSEQDISADELGIVSQDGNIISIQSEPVIAPDNISEEQQLPTTITPRVEVDFFGIPIQKDEQFTGGIETNINQDTIAGVQDMPAPIVYEIPEPIPRMQFSEKSMSDSDTEQNNIIESPVEIIPIPEFQITEPNNSQQITSVQSEVVAT